MSDVDQEQKTEPATEKHLAEAFERGQFAKSPELQVLILLAAALIVLTMTAEAMSRDVAGYAIGMFSRFATTVVTRGSAVSLLGEVMLTVGQGLLPLLGACVIGAVLAGGFQSGFRLSSEVLGLKFDSLDPAAGFGRMFTKAVLVRGGIDLLKLIAIGAALWAGTRHLVADPLFTAPVEAAYLAQFLHRATLDFFGQILLALGGVAALGYGYEKFKTSRDLMMTRQQVKDERRNVEGNALVKGAQRRLGRRLMQKQMLAAVATADMVLTNPTHYAVALRYERGRDQAPVVLAKGENRFAQRIKALAAAHGVPLVENKPVARLLFSLGQVGEAIPAELYQAVASILAVVYRTHRYYFHRLKSRRFEAAA
ncbi:MAG: EscU/YscU/HrcU family type III secretion system export apparatus switch protein [Opitutae bacterium]|nr:EscU/YscU/HrcU family type III secretion system export apparatus switch protein [Opitutae bacterium]